MDEKYILLLVQRLYENQSKEDAYAIPLEQGGKEFNYLKESVQEYLKTNEGKLAIKETKWRVQLGRCKTLCPSSFLGRKKHFPIIPKWKWTILNGKLRFFRFCC